ncbi:hypothetical protein CKM354_000719900 [Cercospora kikuchii]|uniref:Probable endonuclease LCL3 n=1 Tax=Cercospora kikuchii TaxID=84275 RepID=A0A9P3CQN4_9PEZI|nr:uncharacterized protein CKM354_000719900 [Cercospora kikuchii]GIZ43990.1 hypothetical protein CKM354_000719900 [Cercospora kikuchii]
MGWFWSEGKLSGHRNHSRNTSENGTSSNLAAALPSQTSSTLSSNNLRTLGWCTATATLAISLPLLYKRHLRRIRTAEYISPKILRKKSLYGYVTRVGDADNFRLYHTPLGRFAGWGWYRRIPTKRTELSDETIHVRIAGIDAPELPHFGQPGQPHGQDALKWLTGQLLNQRVRVLPLAKDQYGRVVGMVHMRDLLVGNRDVGLEMIKAGWAGVYEAKKGAEYGGKEQEYREAEARAKQKKVGMWGGPGVIGKLLGKKQEVLESPREFKTRQKKVESKPK